MSNALRAYFRFLKGRTFTVLGPAGGENDLSAALLGLPDDDDLLHIAAVAHENRILVEGFEDAGGLPRPRRSDNDRIPTDVKILQHDLECRGAGFPGNLRKR